MSKETLVILTLSEVEGEGSRFLLDIEILQSHGSIRMTVVKT